MEKIQRPKIRPNKEIEDRWIRLSSNEPAYGLSRKYPYTWKLYEEIAKKYNVNTENILITAGSEQGIRFVFDSFVDLGANTLRPEPTFGMLEVFEYYRSAVVYKVNYIDFKINVQEIKNIISNNKISLLYIANPDNPTGAKIDLKDIISTIQHAKKNNTIVLLDEAYYHYNEDLETTHLINEFDNLIITRSFSKIYGLAGERVGFILSNSKNIDIISLQRSMNEITSHSVKFAIKALNSNIVSKNLNHVKRWQNIFRQIDFKKFKYIETYCNFITLELIDKEAIQIFESNKISIRVLYDKYIRISIGKNRDMRKVLKILNKVEKNEI